MSTIAAGGVSGMTSEVKTLHVKPEVGTIESDGGGWNDSLAHHVKSLTK